MERSGMKPDDTKKHLEKGKSEADAALDRIISVIVNEFNGDTVAFYESIRKDDPAKTSKADESHEACIAQKFVKSV
jgi:hypothetical protein